MINYQNFSYNGKKISFSKSQYANMINANDMEKAFDGKTVRQWMDNKSTQEFIHTLASMRGYNVVEKRTSLTITELASMYPKLIYVKRGGIPSQSEQGTWLHEDLAIEFARWLSPVFAVWCNDRIKELLTTGKTELPKSTSSFRNPPVPTEDVTKDDTIMMHAQRMRDKDYSISDVAAMIVWGKYHIPRRTFVGYLYEHGFLRTHETGVAYPTEQALALGLFCVIDKCKRGANKQLKKPRVRITMDGANYFINVLQHGLRGVYSVNRACPSIEGIKF